MDGTLAYNNTKQTLVAEKCLLYRGLTYIEENQFRRNNVHQVPQRQKKVVELQTEKKKENHLSGTGVQCTRPQ